MQPPTWKAAVTMACARGDWRGAYIHAAGAGLDKDGWKRVAEFIEAEKAKALAELTRQWRERTGR